MRVIGWNAANKFRCSGLLSDNPISTLTRRTSSACCADTRRSPNMGAAAIVFTTNCAIQNPNGPPLIPNIAVKFNESIVRAGVNYKLGG
jgi:hypothetical protein